VVTKNISTDISNNYRAPYDKYWPKEVLVGESSCDLEDTANQIITVCGVGKTLDIGSGEGLLVEILLERKVDAYGIDVSEVFVSRCNQRLPGRFTCGSVLELPFDDESFQTVVSTDCMEHLAPKDVLQALKELWRISKRYVFLKIATTQDSDAHWHLTVEGRSWWETQCFAAGFRKHPAYYRINSFESLNHDSWQVIILLEKIPEMALLKYPLASLREERDLHMDMLRETGSRSDAHVGRYFFAAKFVRPGDAVLDAACGLGYGTHVVRSLTKARSFTSIDGSEYAVDYAQHNFGSEEIAFCQGLLPDCLATIPSNSIDHVLCFETLEHVQDPIGLLAEFHRVLTPGGRINCSVPNDWSDETGNDPNPFHLHVYNKSRFLGELKQFFDVEHLVAQTADRVKQAGPACVWLKRPRSLMYFTEEQNDIEAEWLLAVATKSPLNGDLVTYNEHLFSQDEIESAGHSLAFARDYSNPWLIRSLVSIGLRTENPVLRERWASAVWDDSNAGAADRGAALCVMAYAQHSAGADSPSVRRLFGAIEKYLSGTEGNTNPSVLRWRVSLMFVGGLLALAGGQRETAARYFQDVVAAPVDQYSATLLTKPAEAAYLLGLLLADQGNGDDAYQVWWGAFKQISVAIGLRLCSGYELRPPPFEVREMASALSLCSRLVAAAANLDELVHRPAVFYDEAHADSVSQAKSLLAAEVQLSNLHKDLLLQKAGYDELAHGKEWLETQWKASEAERMRLQEALDSLQSGKVWLETQWKTQSQELDRNKVCLDRQQIEISELATRLAESDRRLDSVKQSLFFRIARKLGLIDIT
jgi:ubiquinone/menaquinone biosynthesis C-methylase UbiE